VINHTHNQPTSSHRDESDAEHWVNPADHDHMNSVAMRELVPGTSMRLDTANSSYHIKVLDGRTGAARIQGGSLFHDEADVWIDGSTHNGVDLHAGWIDVDRRLVFTLSDRRGMTSRIRAITVDESSGEESA
jgi:hypothetical protein